MMSPKQKKISKAFNAISIGLLIIALFLGSSSVTVGTSMYSNVDSTKLQAQSFCEEPVVVAGTVTVASFDEYTTVAYEYDGKEYSSEQVIFTEDYPAGSLIDVYVNPEKPSEVQIPDLYIPVYQKYGKFFLTFGLCVSLGLSAVSIILIFVNRGMKIKSRKSE